MPTDWWWPMPFFGMLMMPVMLVIFLVVALLIIIPLMRWLGVGAPSWHGPHQLPGQPHTALDILDERFARGEIDATEYEARKRLITQR